MAYGRSITAQKGGNIDYRFAERGASDYLNPTQQIAYSNALTEAAKPMDAGTKDFKTQRKQIESREYTMEQVNRLRDLAGMNALGEFDAYRQNFSKPYKVNASRGFLADEEVGAESGALVDDTRKLKTVEDQRASTVQGFRDVEKGNTWAQRYEALRKPRTLSDKAWNYGGSQGNMQTAGDERIALREKFKNMRLGIDIPNITVHKSGNKMKGWDSRFNEDPTGMLFDRGFKQAAQNISMKGKNSAGVLKNLSHRMHGGNTALTMLGGDWISPLVHAANAPGYGGNAYSKPSSMFQDPEGYGKRYEGKYGSLYEQLRINPEDIYSGTWGYGTGASSDQAPGYSTGGLYPTQFK